MGGINRKRVIESGVYKMTDTKKDKQSIIKEDTLDTLNYVRKSMERSNRMDTMTAYAYLRHKKKA